MTSIDFNGNQARVRLTYFLSLNQEYEQYFEEVYDGSIKNDEINF